MRLLLAILWLTSLACRADVCTCGLNLNGQRIVGVYQWDNVNGVPVVSTAPDGTRYVVAYMGTQGHLSYLTWPQFCQKLQAYQP